MSEDLLDLAFALARDLSASGRPKSIELRRAISSAYYALFHALCQLCADQLVGGQPWRVFTPMYRTVDHRTARKVLAEARRGDADPDMASLAITFMQLQNARHDADYSPEPFGYNRSETIEMIQAGRQAVAFLQSLRADQKLTLAVRLVARTR